ncbi:hypothetical protein ABZU76_10855 [Amycolatopsis sp. NPDC005232]|uniref:hypothetical protein n=1 Tax=Amycolatopsis sp. NPDC005232 TaxID=3157027 RepID=UPI0033B490AA
MNDDNVRHLWSDAELDEALDALHPHVRTDPAELDRARATLLRAAAAETGRVPTAPPKKKRSGAWRWIAVAAAVAVVTGGVVIAREAIEPRMTVAPAATATADTVPAAGQYTHVTNTYTDIEWVGGTTSAFAVRQTVEYWIPADPSGVWKRKWTRPKDAVILKGRPFDGGSLPGPATTTQVAAGGNFTEAFPHPGGWTTNIPEGWYRPTPRFIASLPADPPTLKKLARDDLHTKYDQVGQPLAPYTAFPSSSDNSPASTLTTSLNVAPPVPETTGNHLTQDPFTPPYLGPGATEMRLLTVLCSGLAPRPLRAALINTLAGMATSTEHHGEISTYTIGYGNHELIVNVNTSTSQLLGAGNVATKDTYGISAGRGLSTAQFSYEVTSDFGS